MIADENDGIALLPEFLNFLLDKADNLPPGFPGGEHPIFSNEVLQHVNDQKCLHDKPPFSIQLAGTRPPKGGRASCLLLRISHQLRLEKLDLLRAQADTGQVSRSNLD